jgi:hypothetical protein
VFIVVARKPKEDFPNDYYLQRFRSIVVTHRTEPLKRWMIAAFAIPKWMTSGRNKHLSPPDDELDGNLFTNKILTILSLK